LALAGTDCIDPGSFASSADFIAAKSWILLSASERGDHELATYLEKSIRACSTTKSDGCGGTYIAELSGFSNIALATGIFSGPEDFRNTVNVGPPKHTFEGPLLAEAPYPDVIVAKAWSYDGNDLDIVLYPGQEGKSIKAHLSLERLRKGVRYSLIQWESKKTFKADGQGKAVVEVVVEGRTPIMVAPVS